MKIQIVKLWGKDKRRCRLYGVKVPAENQWGFTIYTPNNTYPGGFIWGTTNWEEVEEEKVPLKYREGIQDIIRDLEAEQEMIRELIGS